MPTKRQVLDALTREELAGLVDGPAAAVESLARPLLIDWIEAKGPPLPALLAGFSQDRLLELCRAFDLDPSLGESWVLIARLVRGNAAVTMPPGA